MKMNLSDSTLDHLREVVDLPDLTGTRYQIDGEVGRGGLGVVYSALDSQLGRRVAIKVLDSPDEARVIANLEHPAIVPVYEAGTLPDGRAFYAVLHRDLKPQNVMIGRFGEVYVMDWGVAGIAGTPQFRAPEQGEGSVAEVDQRSDVYALGGLLAFVLPEDAPRAMKAIAAKAMRANPDDRYPLVSVMLLDLQRFQDGLAVEAFPESLWQKCWRFAVHNRVLLLLLAAYVAVRFILYFLRRV